MPITLEPEKLSPRIEGVAVADGGKGPTISLAGPLILFGLIIVVNQIIKIAIEVVVTSDDGTQAGNQRHLETPFEAET